MQDFEGFEHHADSLAVKPGVYHRLTASAHQTGSGAAVAAPREAAITGRGPARFEIGQFLICSLAVMAVLVEQHLLSRRR